MFGHAPDEVVKDVSWCRIVCPINEWISHVLHVLVSCQKVLEPVAVEGSDWFRKVPIRLWVCPIEAFAFVVGNDPGEHRIPGKVVKGPTSRRVECQQIVVIRQVATMPLSVDSHHKVPIRMTPKTLGQDPEHLFAFSFLFKCQKDRAAVGKVHFEGRIAQTVVPASQRCHIRNGPMVGTALNGP